MITPEQQAKINEYKAKNNMPSKTAVPTNETAISRVLTKAREKRAATEATQMATDREANYQKPFLERASDVVKKAGANVHDAITGEGNYEGEGVIRRGVEATANAFNAIPQLAKEAIPSVNARKGIDMVGEAVGDVAKKGIDALADTDLIKGAVGGDGNNPIPVALPHNPLNPIHTKSIETPLDLEDTLGTAGAVGEIAGDVMGVEGGLATAKSTINVAKKIPKVVDVVQTSRNVAAKSKIDDAVGRIIQGKPGDVAIAKRALSDIDTAGIKDYKTLTKRLDDNAAALTQRVDNELANDTRIFKKFNLARETKVKGIDGVEKSVYDAPVISALDELEAYYAKVGDVANKTRVAQYKTKLDTEGLRLQDVNNIARMHGRDLNAFNANGQLASGASKEAIENTRSALKDVVRQNMPDDVTRALDSAITDTIRTRDLTNKMTERVTTLYQKIKNRTLSQKVGGALADIADLATLGTLRGFVQKILPSNVGLKTANSLDLEKELAKNLSRVEKLNAIEDPKLFSEALNKYLEEVQPGLSTRVTSNLTEPEKDALLAKLHEYKATETIKNDEIDLELFDRLEALKELSEKSKGLSEREYAELDVLMKEMEGFNGGANPSQLDLDKHGTPRNGRKLGDPVEGGVYYHGTIKANKQSLLDEGFNPKSNKKGFAEQEEAFYIGDYSEASNYGDDMVSVRVKKGEKINTLDYSGQEWADVVGKSTSKDQTAEGLRELRKRGYDAINYGDEIEILNPSKFEIIDAKKEKSL